MMNPKSVNASQASVEQKNPLIAAWERRPSPLFATSLSPAAGITGTGTVLLTSASARSKWN